MRTSCRTFRGLPCDQVKQLEAGLHCVRLQRAAGQDVEARVVAPGELLGDVVRRSIDAPLFITYALVDVC